MKIKLETLVASNSPLMQLAQEKLQAKTAYILQRHNRIIRDELKTYDAARVDLINSKYGTKQEDDTYRVMPDRQPAFFQELSPLLAVELELDLRKISLTELTCPISAATLLDLEWMVTFPEEDTKKEPRKRHKSEEAVAVPE